MTTERFELFLKNAGNAYLSEETKFGGITTFSERGYEYTGLGYKNDPDLLHLRCRSMIPPEFRDERKLAGILLALEVDYPVVKLRSLGSGDTLGFEVSTEQFEANSNALEDTIWRSIDLMRNAVDDCCRRLQLKQEPEALDAGGQDEKWVAHIEDALRNGCPPENYESASVSARLRASLGLVILADESTGSAFCIHASDSASFYVTNAHVVEGATEVTVYRQTPKYEKMLGSVVAKGDVKDVDLALVSVPTANIATLAIHQGAIETDAPAGLAGYARVQIWAADTLGELAPSIHFGTITSVNKSGSIILHDALSRPGNSGGPLFDPLTGDVFGVEKGGWEGEEEAIAIGAPTLTSFLLKHAATFTAPPKGHAKKHAVVLAASDVIEPPSAETPKADSIHA